MAGSLSITAKPTQLSDIVASCSDLVVEVLLPKLPLPALINLKQVCKSWRKLLSDPSTYTRSRSTHFLLQLAPHPQPHPYSSTLFLLAFDAGKNLNGIGKIPGQSKIYGPGGSVVGTAGGIICLYSRTEDCFRVWNPATCQNFELPPYQHRTLDPSALCTPMPTVMAFGYLSGGFVVAVIWPGHLHIYTTEFRIWENTTTWYKEDKSTVRCDTIIHNILYWTTGGDRDSQPTASVFQLNLTDNNKLIKRLPGLEGFLVNYFGVDSIFLLKGHLSLLCYKSWMSWDIWTVKGDGKEWELAHSFDHPPIWSTVLLVMEDGDFLEAEEAGILRLMDMERSRGDGFALGKWRIKGRVFEHVTTLVDVPPAFEPSIGEKLQSRKKSQSENLKQLMDQLRVVSSLCSVLGLDFIENVRDLHPSLVDGGKASSISTESLGLMQLVINVFIKRLRELKLQRIRQLEDHATMLVELWDLMDTPVEEQERFHNVTCKIAASEDELTDPDMLSEDFIKHVETEVFRLKELKSSKMEELVLRKRAELEELCRKTHLVPEVAAVETGALDFGSVLEQILMDVAKVKEEAFARNEILEKVEKWLSAREEEEWLEEYSQDENRHSAHLILKRAEKARILVNNLPGMVDALAAKVLSWEIERGVEFMYDGVRLLSMLEEYMTVRQEEEKEDKTLRELKKHQKQFITEQESIFSSKLGPFKGGREGGNGRGLSDEGIGVQNSSSVPYQSTRATLNSHPDKNDDRPGTKMNVSMALDITNPLARDDTCSGSESVHTVEEENGTPNLKTIQVPTTPSTVSDPMQAKVTYCYHGDERKKGHRSKKGELVFVHPQSSSKER